MNDRDPRGLDRAEDGSSPPRPSRLALILFAFYLALYAGFVLLNSFRPDIMEWRPFGGVNLALLYGLGLIAAAFALAVLYDALRRGAGGDGKDAP